MALVVHYKGKSNAVPFDTVLKGYCSLIGLIDFNWLTDYWYMDKFIQPYQKLLWSIQVYNYFQLQEKFSLSLGSKSGKKKKMMIGNRHFNFCLGNRKSQEVLWFLKHWSL